MIKFINIALIVLLFSYI